MSTQISDKNIYTWYKNVMREEPKGYPSYHNKYKVGSKGESKGESSCSTSRICGPCNNGPKPQFYPFKSCQIGVL